MRRNGKSIQKKNLPEKICLTCHRPFAWRKKWERNWNEVNYCSDACRRNRKKMNMKKNKVLRLILGDQLNYKHSWFNKQREDVTYVLMEMRQETDYARHHAQKIIGFFAAMYNFVNFLRKNGHSVIYLQIQDKENQQSLTENLNYLIKKHSITKFEYQLPDEYRIDEQLKKFTKETQIEVTAFDTEHFITQRDELREMFMGKKIYLMETFYRKLRQRTGVLMNGKEPEGGKWNYDVENRKPFKSNHQPFPPLEYHHDYTSIWNEIEKAKVFSIGKNKASDFPWPTTRNESIVLLDYFLDELLPFFGTYQDAMTSRSWSLFHSRISFSLNTKMISPMEVIKKAETCYRKDPQRYTLPQVEGFIRQILGWREYMRGIYWAEMPRFSKLNFFDHQRKLPQWYWTGKTKMACIQQAISQSLEHGYAHHIQRLMVTGNFALLAGIDPDEVDAWYLGIYCDAIEWVEITNTRGMSQFADGGIVGTKPYISSAAYINKMSDHCSACTYHQKVKTGENACPFNSLYWNFLDQHREKLEKNPRMGMMYKVWDKMKGIERAELLEQAKEYLEKVETL
jgi:deoxyribodipyrimidine photolyase-related protein